jgi:hypothetical protein
MDTVRHLEGRDEDLLEECFPATRLGFEIGEKVGKCCVQGLAVVDGLASLLVTEGVGSENSFEGLRPPVSNCDGVYLTSGLIRPCNLFDKGKHGVGSFIRTSFRLKQLHAVLDSFYECNRASIEPKKINVRS